MVTNRTGRALCIEFGLAIHQGVGKFQSEMPCVLTKEENDLRPRCGGSWEICSLTSGALRNASLQ
jgi:hypothetical protein